MLCVQIQHTFWTEKLVTRILFSLISNAFNTYPLLPAAYL